MSIRHHARVIETETWKQPFQSGLLLAFDDEADWSLPEGVGTDGIASSATCIAVPVLHAQDVEIPDDWPDDEDAPEAEVEVTVALGSAPPGAEFVGTLACPSGRLNVGDAESSRVFDVPVGVLAVAVSREPTQFAESVTITVSQQ
jgi:hypothetical protein